MKPRKENKSTLELMREAIDTFEERNAIYKDNYVMVGKLLEVLHPSGLNIKTAEEWNLYHLYILMIVKLSRFAISGLKHQDSLRDLAVYAFMVEREIQNG